MKLLRFTILALLIFPVAAEADTSPLYYVRTTIVIHHKNDSPQPAASLPWQKGTSGLILDVEVRDGRSMYNQEGWYNLSAPSENGGVMMAFSSEDLSPIIRSTQYAPLDILMINHEGTITQIVPNIKLSELEDEIVPSSPVQAFLFVRGGLCEKLSIKPGDIVEYKLFRRPPVVLSAPTPSAQAAPQPAPAQAPANQTPPGLTQLMDGPKGGPVYLQQDEPVQLHVAPSQVIDLEPAAGQ